MAAADWIDANQNLLTSELAWLRHRLAADADPSMPQGIPDREEAQTAMPAPAAIDIVCGLFGLSPFERQLLLLCCGVELDARIAAAFARIHGSDFQRNTTFGLALSILPDAHWSALTPLRPLRRWRLLEVEPGMRLVDSPLRVDERILHFIAGINMLDARLRPLLIAREPPSLIAAGHESLADTLVEQLYDERHAPALVHLDGNDSGGHLDIAGSVAKRLGWQLYALRAEDLPSDRGELGLFQTLWERDSRLLPALLLLQAADTAHSQALTSFAERLQAPLFVSCRDPLRLRRPLLSYTVDRPTADEQKQLWLSALGTKGARLNGAIDSLSTQFRLSAHAIASVAGSLDNAEDADPKRSLWHACRRIGRERLQDLAECIEPFATWDDLILPPAHQATLRQIAAHMRQRLRVYQDWGFARHGSRGLGVSALFCGESGTGKTLAAEVLAHELDLDLYRIDLSSVVSKYIGETEKNLRRLFDAAENSGAILLFDEADALFGKRSEVKDSHDRYANIEISYLLQRMEAYSGLAILTTNMKTALDRAFHRRLRFIVHFPFPDAKLREAIWRRAFPIRVPLDGVDYRKLAKLNLPGGNIRNIALNAAFLAAEADSPLSMEHLRAAAQAESAKTERPLSEAETRGWI